MMTRIKSGLMYDLWDAATDAWRHHRLMLASMRLATTLEVGGRSDHGQRAEASKYRKRRDDELDRAKAIRKQLRGL